MLVSAYGTVFGLALIARFAQLDNIPGLNGDEAWYGLWAERLLAGTVSDWHTPTGNLINPFLLLPLCALQAVTAPAPWVLRFGAAISGVAFVAVGFLCLRCTCERRSAAIFAVLAASLPTAIVYSRFGWDASQTPLAAIIFIYCCLTGRLALALLAWVAALIVHPTNVFLFPIFAAFLAEELKQPVAKIAGDAVARRLVPIVLIGGALTAILVSIIVRPDGAMRLLSAHYWLWIFVLLSDLFSGVTVDRFIAGGVGWPFIHRAVVTAILAGTLLFWLCRGRDAQRDPVRTLSAGLAVSIFAFAAIVGPAGLAPNWERYALFLVAPVLAVASVALSRSWRAEGDGAVWSALLCSGLALASVWTNYFEPLRGNGGAQSVASRSYYAFHTATVEPKVQAADWLSRPGARRSTVFAADWWLSMPLQYLLYYDPRLTVRPLGNSLPQATADGTVAVVFAGSELADRLSATGARDEASIADGGGAPFLKIYRIE